MKEIRKTTQFKKDFKRYKNNKEFIELLFRLICRIAEGESIPEEFDPHPLKGDWKNYTECHVENDTLLIWYDNDKEIVELIRLGSHSELFGKSRKK